MLFWGYDLSCIKYLGDAFPFVWPNFGPGIVAAFLGADLENGNNTVWFKPSQTQDIRDVRLEYNADNVWLGRIRAILGAALKRWGGLVQIGFTDFGGILDILASIRGTEQLLIDLYDHPEEVERLISEIHNLWWKYYLEYENICLGINPGYSSWEGLFSEQRYSILQCDTIGMLSRDMVKRFVMPEIEVSLSKFSNSFYHMDGPGQIVHLDPFLKLENLKGIQWVPGAGQPDISNWPELYQKIRSANKLIQFFCFQYEGELETLLTILKSQLGTLKGIACIVKADISEESRLERMLDSFID